MTDIGNRAVAPLVAAGLVRAERIEPFHPRTRDRADLAVLRCAASGVVFLQSSDHIDEMFYAEKRQEDAIARATRSDAVKDADTARRVATHGGLVAGRRWLDAGSGEGRMLGALGPAAATAMGYDPARWRPSVNAPGAFPVVGDLADVAPGTIDIVTLYHVLEHVPEPVTCLEQLVTLLDDGGRIVVEVPHGRDALLMRYACMPYRDHTLWSEHLVLHTRESLSAVIEAAGLTVERIDGCQRYPLANHLHWLCRGEAGGQERWPALCDPDLDAAYAARLIAADETDTLVAVARKAEQ